MEEEYSEYDAEYDVDAKVDYNPPDLVESDGESDDESASDGDSLPSPILRRSRSASDLDSPTLPLRRSHFIRKTAWKDGSQTAKLCGTIIHEPVVSLLDGPLDPRSGYKRRRGRTTRHHKHTKLRKQNLMREN